MLRSIFLHFNYWYNKLTKRNIKFKGFCVLFPFPGSKITIGGGEIFSSFSSNMLGLWQPTIIVARYGGKIEIGHHVGISGSTIYAFDSIKIGNHTRVGANCKIIDNDFHPIELEFRHKGLNETHTKRKPISIEDDCFIGMNSIILKGTILGNNVVVGAGSVVSGHFPDNCIIAGNPAKIIKMMEV